MISILVLVWFFGLIFPSCTEIDKSQIDNLNGGKIEVIGHAGSAFLYPMLPFNPLPSNSMASIEKALVKNRADGIEVDLQMSADSVLILYHDTGLETMTEIKGCISNLSSEEIIGLEYNTGFVYNSFHSEKVISFAQLLTKLNSLEQFPLLHLDLKNFDDCKLGGNGARSELYAEKVVEAIRKYHVPINRLLFASADKEMLLKIKSIDPGLTIMLDENIDFEAGKSWVLKNKFAGMVIGNGIANKQLIKEAHEDNLKIVIFGGRSRGSIIEIIEKNPDAIQVNNVRQMRHLLD